MNVFIWKSYGNVKVYNAETKLDIIKIFNEITEYLENWNLDKEILDHQGIVAKYFATDDVAKMKRIVMSLLAFTGHNHESFEYTQFSEVIDL